MHDRHWLDVALELAQENLELQPQDDDSALRAIQRSASVLALVWGAAPQSILFWIAASAPDEDAWGRLVSKSWDGLSPSQRATLNGLATEEAA